GADLRLEDDLRRRAAQARAEDGVSGRAATRRRRLPLRLEPEAFALERVRGQVDDAAGKALFDTAPIDLCASQVERRQRVLHLLPVVAPLPKRRNEDGGSIAEYRAGESDQGGMRPDLDHAVGRQAGECPEAIAKPHRLAHVSTPV